MKENYTKILEAEPENSTINLLADLLSGKYGELTNITQYFFQKILTNDENLKKILNDIMFDEMKHVELLATAIIEFGGVPYLCNQFNKFFTTEYIDYAMNERQFLISNIRAEEKALKDYGFAIEKIENESLKKLLNEICDDEKKHLELLRQQLENF